MRSRAKEFRAILERAGDRRTADLDDAAFSAALSAIDAAAQQQVIELTGRVVDGQL